ncbi:MAG TPA: acetylglutamate kinase [Alphaproteobacteria bacterium]|nr:acetylglutamate kinase [Alphaproteobacteria bacterium]
MQTNFTETKYWLRTARTISEALPYMRRYSGRSFVIKYGGHAMTEPALANIFASDIVLLKQVGINPVVVHGGGPQIGNMLEKLNIKSQFIDGLRVTDQASIEIVEMVLSGTINKHIVAAINAAGGSAVGLSGRDAHLIRAKKLTSPKGDLGLVGEPTNVDPHVLSTLESAGVIPVVAPVGTGPNGEILNINADTAAGAIAGAVRAARLLMLTDVPGVLSKNGSLIENLSVDEVRELIQDGTIHGGMIPKLETCIQAIEQGIEAAVVLDGRVPHALLLEIFTPRGLGTLITKKKN